MQLFFQKSKLKKYILASSATLVLVLLVSLLQTNILKVKADVQVLIVSDTALPFGTVFPGQVLTKSYTVLLDTSAQNSTYSTTLDPVAGFGDLCPHLNLTSLDNPAESDTLASASLTRPDDIIDDWQVSLNTPALKGQIAQDHSGGIVVTSGDYMCKITITTDSDVAGDGGCQGLDCGNNGGGPGIALNSFSGGGGGSGGSGIPTIGDPNGLVEGVSTTTPSGGQRTGGGSGSTPPGEVLGATELPRTGLPVNVVIVLTVLGFAIVLGYKKTVKI